MNPYIWRWYDLRDPWNLTIIFELRQSSSFWCKVVIGKQSSPLNTEKPRFGPPDCKINIYQWIEKGVYHHEKWLFGNKTSSSLATCMSTFHSHGHEYVPMYVSSLSTSHQMGFLIPILYKMCDLQSTYIPDHASQ